MVVENRGLVVPLGRSVYVTRDHLKLKVIPGDSCHVTVLHNDPLAQRPGRLMPASFPCHFGDHDVIYSHFGARNPPFDVIRLQIRYDTERETTLIPITLHVEVSFVQLEVITRNMPITVDKVRGVSTPIDGHNLEFDFSRDTELCKLSVLPRESGLPRYGLVINDSSVLQMVDCDKFLQLGVRYKHNATTSSPDKDYLALVVEIIDPEGSIVKREYFQILVRILEGRPNRRPEVDYNSALTLEVNQFIMTAVTSEILAAEDHETDDSLLIFNITEGLREGQGNFVSTDDRSKHITAFYQKDIEDLKIAYRPPEGDSSVQRNFFITLQIIDSDGAVSDPIVLIILVKPMNTMSPIPTTNEGISLFEGQSRALKYPNLRLSDEDNLKDVTIRVITGLRHGKLEIPNNRDFFTDKDLRQGLVRYHHDDSDSYSDNIILRASDDRHVIEFLFPIWVFPEDDRAPVVQYNTMLQVKKHEMAEISPFVLSATDADTEDRLIRFVLEPPYSEESIFLRRQYQMPEEAEEWSLTDGVYEQIVEEFTQGDIDEGNIFYQHIGEHSSDFVMDHIRFYVVDTADPPNR